MKQDIGVKKNPEFALTSMQIGLLSESFVATQPWVNLEQVVVHFGNTPVREDQVKAGLKALAQRHDALQMMIRWDDTGRPNQMLKPSDHVPIIVSEKTAAPDEARLDQLEAFLDEDRLRGFDLVDHIMWRANLIRWGGAHAVLVLTIHHAIADGRSMARLAQDLIAFLQTGALPPANPDTMTFEGFCREISETVPNSDEAEAYFKAYLKDTEDAGALNLPEGGGVDPTQKRKRQITRTLTIEDGVALRQVAAQNGATLANLVQAAWGILLSRWQGCDAVTFGVVRSGRHAMPNCHDTVGCLINTLPTCVKLDPELTVSDLLSALRQHMLSLHSLEQTPADLIRRSIGLHGAKPLFETAVMFENAGIESLVTDDVPSAWVEKIELREEGGMPLMLSVYAEDAIKILLEYDPSVVGAGIAERMFGHLLRLMGAMSKADDSTRIAALDMLDPGVRETLLGWSMPDSPLEEPGTCLVERFRDVVRDAPDAAALEEIGQDDVLSFAGLDRRSDRLAKVLQDHGAAPGGIVAVNLSRSADFVVAVLAVLKTGAAFMPVDPIHPDAMRAHMLSDSNAQITIHAGGVTSGDRTTPIPQDLDPVADPIACPEENTDQLAYVIYTSGSTGTPKGVRVTRGNLLAHVTALTQAYGMSSEDRVLQFAGLSFDVAIEEIFTTLMSGATLVLRSDEMAESASMFLDQVEAHKLSVLNIPTAFWTVLTKYMGTSQRGAPPSVRVVVVGGETVSPQTLSEWLAIAPEPRWLNGYGPTETTITCTLFEPDSHQPDEDVSIGRPTAHAQAYVIASDGSLAPKGAVGELAIGGPAVTQGYIGRPGETARAFRPNKFSGKGRIYCTGDRARWLDCGNLQFLGRQDRQIKLRGHRIELGQVERAVEKCLPGVEMLCDVLDKNTPSARLVVWIASPEAPDLTAVSNDVAALLPSYMRPALVHLPQFPRTPSDKIDRRALPRPAATPPPDAQGKTKATQLETQICQTMAAVLNLPHVDPDQSFFDLGGHSLLSIEFIGRIEVVTGKKLGIVDFRDNPSPRALSKVLEIGSQTSKHIIPIQPQGSKAPLLGIHILGANEEYFHPMARYLGLDQPVMGVSVGSLDENTPTGVEFTASRYCEEINRYYPTGPVHLMAASLGSYVAFELAQQLHASGRNVGMLAFFDAAGPDGRKNVTGFRKIRAHLRRARYLGWGYPAQIIHNRIHNFRHMVATRQINRKSKFEENLPPKTVFEFIASNELAVQDYTPQPIDIPLIIFRSESSFFDSEETKANGLGWASVARAGFKVIDVPGGHLSMLQEPNIPTLASEMQTVLKSL
ncbi:amino acid adenylation domain-containing protein [Roseovarius sp. M141]|uniref:non-ribosomal peptide synthetase n=1 Tax=Roseovarius sp. M141 TaxID=2583806 RepID=UPI0020CD69DC|nr:amino acid adenylation domain-containing protein [Roseovarius sp. M141]